MKRMESFEKNHPPKIVNFVLSPVVMTGNAIIIFGFTLIDMLSEMRRKNPLKSFKAYFM